MDNGLVALESKEDTHLPPGTGLQSMWERNSHHWRSLQGNSVLIQVSGGAKKGKVMLRKEVKHIVY